MMEVELVKVLQVVKWKCASAIQNFNSELKHLANVASDNANAYTFEPTIDDLNKFFNTNNTNNSSLNVNNMRDLYNNEFKEISKLAENAKNDEKTASELLKEFLNKGQTAGEGEQAGEGEGEPQRQQAKKEPEEEMKKAEEAIKQIDILTKKNDNYMEVANKIEPLINFAKDTIENNASGIIEKIAYKIKIIYNEKIKTIKDSGEKKLQKQKQQQKKLRLKQKKLLKQQKKL